MRAVILAGGKGTRLLPYTTVFPKPLMPINGIPILEVVVRQLKKFGFDQITLAVGYLSELIETFFGDGRKWGLSIDYVKETEPLGTVGCLSLINDLDEPFLVMNGDVLTNLNYRELYQHHIKHNSSITIGMYDKPFKVNLGVIETNGDGIIKNYIEKPVHNYQVSIGVYVFNPETLSLVKDNEYMDFPELVHALLKNNARVIGYKFSGHWLDIGQHEDYVQATEIFQAKKAEFNLE
jgi:NDP-sugar pyrophosphorylase family protein